MLQLSDSSLALLCIAATTVPHHRRQQWLRELADKIEPPPRSKGARYMRALRQRERAGRILLRLEVDEAETVVGLINANLLSPLRGDDRNAITEAAQQALAKFLAGEDSRQQERVSASLKIQLLLRTLREKLRAPAKRRPRRPARPDRAAPHRPDGR